MSHSFSNFRLTKQDKIDYDNLSGRGKENYNFHEVAAILSKYGYNSIRLTDDWNGADFVAIPDSPLKETLYVQLKSAPTIKKSYMQFENLFIAFPETSKSGERKWYLILHRDLVESFSHHGRSADGEIAWKKDGVYWTVKLNKQMAEEFKDRVIG